MRTLSKLAIAISGAAETGQDFSGGMPLGSPSTIAPGTTGLPTVRRWSRMGKPILEEGAGPPLAIRQTQDEMVDRITRKWASIDFWRGFMDIVKTADFETLRKLKARLESVRPIVTRSGQVRRITINA